MGAARDRQRELRAARGVLPRALAGRAVFVLPAGAGLERHAPGHRRLAHRAGARALPRSSRRPPRGRSGQGRATRRRTRPRRARRAHGARLERRDRRALLRLLLARTDHRRPGGATPLDRGGDRAREQHRRRDLARPAARRVQPARARGVGVRAPRAARAHALRARPDRARSRRPRRSIRARCAGHLGRGERARRRGRARRRVDRG